MTSPKTNPTYDLYCTAFSNVDDISNTRYSVYQQKFGKVLFPNWVVHANTYGNCYVACFDLDKPLSQQKECDSEGKIIRNDSALWEIFENWSNIHKEAFNVKSKTFESMILSYTIKGHITYEDFMINMQEWYELNDGELSPLYTDLMNITEEQYNYNPEHVKRIKNIDNDDMVQFYWMTQAYGTCNPNITKCTVCNDYQFFGSIYDSDICFRCIKEQKINKLMKKDQYRVYDDIFKNDDEACITNYSIYQEKYGKVLFPDWIIYMTTYQYYNGLLYCDNVVRDNVDMSHIFVIQFNNDNDENPIETIKDRIMRKIYHFADHVVESYRQFENYINDNNCNLDHIQLVKDITDEDVKRFFYMFTAYSQYNDHLYSEIELYSKYREAYEKKRGF